MLTTCASQMNNQGRYIVSEPMIRRAVTILERKPTERQGALAENLANLAVVLKHSWRLDEAEALHKRAGAIWESPLRRPPPQPGAGQAGQHEAQFSIVS